MQIVRSQQNIIEKVLRDKEGRLVRARFVVYENAGRVKARLIDVRYIDERDIENNSELLLVGIKKEKILSIEFFGSNLVSYFLPQISIYSIGSKPRAPTFA